MTSEEVLDIRTEFALALEKLVEENKRNGVKPLMANKRKDVLTGTAYLRRNESDKPNAPYVKGFVSITPELLEALSNLEPDEYGTVKLEVALWASQDQAGVLKGTAQLPYNVRKNTGDSAPKKPVQSSNDVEF